MNEANVPTISELSAQNDALRVENEALREECTERCRHGYLQLEKLDVLRTENDALRAERQALRNNVEDWATQCVSLRHDLNAALLAQRGQFTVVAGEYNNHDCNTQFIAQFDTLAAAIAAYDDLAIALYAWRYIKYNGRRLTVSDTKS